MDVQSPSALVLPAIARAGGELSPDAVAALIRHPRFAAAMRAALTENVRLYKGNRILNHVGYDRGRLVTAILAFYLHVSREPGDPTSGLTAQRLKSLCVEQDVCSPGRARAMLSLLRLFGYVAPAAGGDRRFKRLEPTELLIASLRQRWAGMFEAVAMMLPEGDAARVCLDRADFLAAFVRSVVDHYRGGLRALQFTPELAPFAERNAGLTILFSLVIAGETDDTMPPTRPVRIPISELARRFSVSRAHVLRLLREAAAEGLVERTGAAQDAVTLLPPLSRALQHCTAIVFLFFARCAREALAEINSDSSSVAG
jgi:DNA-binding MarR family transcriptional regulator